MRQQVTSQQLPPFLHFSQLESAVKANTKLFNQQQLNKTLFMYTKFPFTFAFTYPSRQLENVFSFVCGMPKCRRQTHHTHIDISEVLAIPTMWTCVDTGTETAD